LIPLAINGLGPVGAFGAGITDFKAALTGDIKVTPEITRVTTQNGDHDLPVFRASSKLLANFIKPRKLRRLDNFSRLALLGAVLAVEDSAMELNSERTGLIVASAHGATATTFAFLDSVIEDGDVLASPTRFSNSVHNAAASHISEHFTITGPTLSLTQGADSLTMALLTAGQWLASERVDTVLCGAIDCYCDVLGYCWQSYREQGKTAILNPTAGPGEGALFLHLSRIKDNTHEPKHGYLNRIELNRDAPPTTLPFITASAKDVNQPVSASDSRTISDSPQNQLKANLSHICGELSIPTSFDIATATTIINDKQLCDNYDLQRITADSSLSDTTLCCWQPQTSNQRKPLTGNCYWITNHADFNMREQS
jgi:3-oxoacyl-[acyl-carrier-protein] synthase II